jgi:hypothetical protein
MPGLSNPPAIAFIIAGGLHMWTEADLWVAMSPALVAEDLLAAVCLHARRLVGGFRDAELGARATCDGHVTAILSNESMPAAARSQLATQEGG